MSDCKFCDGQGMIVREDGSAITCRCRVIASYAAQVRAMVPGMEYAGHGCLKGREPLQGSLVLAANWQNALNDLGGWLFRSLTQGKSPSLLITSTAELRVAYTSNTLGQVGNHDLVVVRVLPVAQNKLIADVLLETLALAKSCWLVSSPTNPLSLGHPAWSVALDEFTADFHRVGQCNEPEDITSILEGRK